MEANLVRRSYLIGIEVEQQVSHGIEAVEIRQHLGQLVFQREVDAFACPGANHERFNRNTSLNLAISVNVRTAEVHNRGRIVGAPPPARPCTPAPPGNAAALTAATLMFLLGAFHGQILVAMDFLPVAKSVGSAVTTVPSRMSPPEMRVPSEVVVVVSVIVPVVVAVVVAIMSDDIKLVSVVMVVSVVTEPSVLSL